jgi:hypothetical protein
MKLAIASALILVPAIASADDAAGARVGLTPGAMFLSANGQSATGYGGNAWVGYEVDRGTLAFTPLLDLGYAYFTSTPATNLAFAIPSLQIALHGGSWVPALEAGVGYAYSWTSANGATLSDNFLALSIGAQLDYRVSPGLSVGVAAHYKPLLEPALSSLVDVGVNATFAL